MKQLINYRDVTGNNNYLGEHPAILGFGILMAGQNLRAGTVLGRITASKLFVAFDPSASDGSEVAARILHNDMDAVEDEPIVIVEHAEAIDVGLIWPDAIAADDHQKAIDDLKTAGIYTTQL